MMAISDKQDKYLEYTAWSSLGAHKRMSNAASELGPQDLQATLQLVATKI
jgi:hypothetical protein